jgi:RNA polymerase sigma-70 factor (ECF subfamily)
LFTLSLHQFLRKNTEQRTGKKNIVNSRIFMSTSGHDLTIRLPGVVATGGEQCLGPHEIERLVIEMFDESRNALLRYVSSLGVPLCDGEEIIQEVFLALFRHLQLGRPRDNLRGWIFRVAHNLALKQCLANQKAKLRREPDDRVFEQRDPGLTPEERAAGNQRQERLRAVVEAMPERERRCLYLRAEGLRYREIARVLGMSLGAVSIALTRAFSRLGRAEAGSDHAWS